MLQNHFLAVTVFDVFYYSSSTLFDQDAALHKLYKKFKYTKTKPLVDSVFNGKFWQTFHAML